MAKLPKEKRMIHGILPAAGLASRMRGLPKFLLPASSDYETLLERHIRQMSEVCETIWIPTRPELVALIATLGLSSERVVVLPMNSHSMTETIMKTSDIAGVPKLMIVMPDTYFSGEQPYEFLAKTLDPMNLALWPIRAEQLGKLGQVRIRALPEGAVLDARDKDETCDYPHAWGAMSLDVETLRHATQDMPHTGFMIPELIKLNISIHGKLMDGLYYDCGTPTEYINMLRTEVAATQA